MNFSRDAQSSAAPECKRESDAAVRNAGSGPDDDEIDLAARVVRDPLATDEQELADAFDALAALLIDATRAKDERAVPAGSPPPFTPTGRLTVPPPPSIGEAA